MDVALKVAQTEDQPGWVYGEAGRHYLWETWTGTRYQPTASWNHIMFGTNSEWYFKELAGIVLTQLTQFLQAGRKVLFPKVVTAGGTDICSQLSSVESLAHYDAWGCGRRLARGPVHRKRGCADHVEENTPVTLSALQAKILPRLAAAYGTPNGTCGTKAILRTSGHFQTELHQTYRIRADRCVRRRKQLPCGCEQQGWGDPCRHQKISVCVVAMCQSHHASFHLQRDSARGIDGNSGAASDRRSYHKERGVIEGGDSVIFAKGAYIDGQMAFIARLAPCMPQAWHRRSQ